MDILLSQKVIMSQILYKTVTALSCFYWPGQKFHIIYTGISNFVVYNKINKI